MIGVNRNRFLNRKHYEFSTAVCTVFPMNCALCLRERPLPRSQIVPEFMHGQMYDDKHRFFGISNIESKTNKLFQKGLREELLCADCEQHIGRYESYASRVFYGKAE